MSCLFELVQIGTAVFQTVRMRRGAIVYRSILGIEAELSEQKEGGGGFHAGWGWGQASV